MLWKTESKDLVETLMAMLVKDPNQKIWRFNQKISADLNLVFAKSFMHSFGAMLDFTSSEI